MSEQVNNGAAKSEGINALPVIQKLAQTFDLSAAAFVFTFRAVAMPSPHTEAEFVSCCLVAREHGLNPLTKEIYFMRTKTGQIQPIVSVDGWIKKCNEHPQFDGMEFEDRRDDKGKLTAMTIAIHRKDRSRPTKITEYMDECSANGGAAWKTSASRMLRNRTICQGSRIAFGFAGIMDRDEFDQWQSMRDVTPAQTPAQAPAPAVLELPDIPDDPEQQPEAASQDVEQDDAPITDVDGWLEHMQARRDDCESEAERMDLEHEIQAALKRLPKSARVKALDIVRGE